MCVSIPIGRKLGPSFIKLSNTLKKKIDLARELENRCVVDGLSFVYLSTGRKGIIGWKGKRGK